MWRAGAWRSDWLHTEADATIGVTRRPCCGYIYQNVGEQMSGRNQHHFWQVLQRGFGVQRKPDYTTVFVYQNNKPPFPVGTRNFGAERDFFDFMPGSGADELITKTENELQGLVKYLQNGGQLTGDHTGSISVLIAHLETRTKFLRQHFAETASDLLGEMNRWFANPITFKKMIKKYASDNPDEISAQLAEYVEGPSTRAALIEFMIENFDMLGTKIIESASDDAAHSMTAFAENILELAKQSHIKAILSTTRDSIRRDRYLGLNYRLKSGFGGNLICPDTMTSFLTDGKPKPFLDKEDRLEAVLLPLTSDLMLIGESSTSVDRTSQSVLRILASTSYKAFIANSDAPDLRRLSLRIGKNAQILSGADIKSIKRDTLAGLL